MVVRFYHPNQKTSWHSMAVVLTQDNYHGLFALYKGNPALRAVAEDATFFSS
jgi:hypothetical protein